MEIACKYRLYGPEAYIDKLRKVISIDPVVEYLVSQNNALKLNRSVALYTRCEVLPYILLLFRYGNIFGRHSSKNFVTRMFFHYIQMFFSKICSHLERERAWCDSQRCEVQLSDKVGIQNVSSPVVLYFKPLLYTCSQMIAIRRAPFRRYCI